MNQEEYQVRKLARDLSDRIAKVERKLRSTAAASADLRHSSIDGGKGLTLKDADGNVTYRLGTDPVTGATVPEYKGGPVPNRPDAPFVDFTAEVLKVQHSGLDADGGPAPADFRRAEVHVSLEGPDFEPNHSQTFACYLEEVDGSVTHRLPGGEWWVGVIWVTLSGKRSVMSETVLADIPARVDADELRETRAEAERLMDEAKAYAELLQGESDDGLTQLAADLADAVDDLEAAKVLLDPLPGQVQEARDFASDAMDRAEAAEARAVEASNNASNRLTNGGFELGLDHWDVVNVTLSSDANTGNQSALIGAGGSLSPDASIPVSEGDVWDVSAFGKGGTALVVDVLNAADSSVLESFSTPMGSTWSETGRQRVEIPTGVDYMNIRITGDGVLVDDVVLRDVTDVVRLERAATQARERADQAIAELQIMQLSLDGPGGLKDRLSGAETLLQDKADTSALNQLDEKLRGDITAIESYYSKIWPRSTTPPPAGVSYEWAGVQGNSRSARRSNGVIVAWNQYPNPRFRDPNKDGHPDGLVRYGTGGNTGTVEVTGDGAKVTSSLTGVGRFGLRANQLSKSSSDVFRVEFTADLHPGHRVEVYADQTLQGSFLRSENTTITDSGHHIVELPLSSEANGISIAGTWLSRAAGSEAGESSVTFHRAYIGPRWLESFDGDTLSDRAHDLWYNSDGVPHEWVNGTGWTPISDERIQQLADAVDSHADRLASAETTLANKAETSDLSELDGVLRQAFGEADEAVTQAAALDAQQKATAAQQAAETEAGRLANAEAQAAQTEAIRQAAADALAKAEAARDEAISTSSDDAAAKAQAAREAAEAYAAAESAAKADAAQAEAIRQAALDATEKANQAKTDAEAAAKQYADQQDAQVRADAAADAQTKADAAKDAAEVAANRHADLVAQGAEETAIAEAERLHALAVAEAEAAQQRAEEAHTEAGSAWSHADVAMNRAVTAETNAITEAGRLADAAQEAAEAAAAADATAKTEAAEARAATEALRVARAEAEEKAAAAEDAAKAYADLKAAGESGDALTAAREYAEAQAEAARIAAEAAAAADATAKMEHAEAEAAKDAKAKADQALEDAKADATAKADTAQRLAEEAAALDATAKAEAAEAEAARKAALDALEKANAARDEAIASSSEDASTKAQAAREAAEAYALAESEAKAQAAQAEAIRQAAEDATAKADAAQTAAESNAIAQARAELAALEVGARNLIKDSAPNVTSSTYLVTSFDLGDASPAEGDTVTLSIKGQLGEGRTQWMVYNSGGSVRIQDLTLSTQDDDGVYRVTGAWRVGGSANTHIRVYAFPSSASSESTIEWIKLERGSKATDWQPAPEDIQARIDQAKEDAQAHADSLPKSLGGTTPPTGTAPDGSVWRQRDDSNTILARWERIDGAWVPQQVSGEIIDNLEAGKITALYTEFAEAVINKVWAQLGVFDRLDAREGWVGGVHLEDGAVTADKMTITGDMAAAIISADTARIAELIATDVWAELGVFDRLKAVTGWVGGVNLEDGAITAEKITASREMITKIFATEWAYVSEQLVVAGNLITQNIDAITAQIGNLDVTERANFSQAFAEEMWAALAVFDRLQATTAWIGGTMLEDDSVTTRNIVFTEELVGNIAELLHLVVDRIDANGIWADTAWLTAVETANVRLRSSINDWQTILSGRGMEVISPEGQPTVQLGNFEETGLTLYRHDTSDDANEATASITDDGAISGTVISANDEFYYQGTELSEMLDIDDSRYALGVVSERVFAADRATWYTETGVGYVGWLAVPGRRYKITVTGEARDTRESRGFAVRIRLAHTANESIGFPEPSINDELLQERIFRPENGAWTHFHMTTTWEYPTPDLAANKPTRVLITLGPRTAAGSAQWRNGGQVIVEDMGLTPASLSGWHDGGAGGGTPPAEPTPIKRRRTTTFTMDWWRVWWQNGNVPSSGIGTREVAQGRTPYFTTAGLYRSMVGFPSMTSTLSGADIEKVEVRVRVTHTHSGRGGRVRLGVHGLVNRPTHFAYNDLELTNTQFSRSQEKWVTLPSSTHAGFKNGTHRGIVTYSSSSSTDYYVQMNPSRFAIRITYRK